MASTYGHEANGQGGSTSGGQAWPNMFGMSQAAQASQPQQQTTFDQHQQSYISRHLPSTAAWDNGAAASTNNYVPTTKSESVLDLFASMPSAQDDPTRHQMWTELVRYKTRALELQITEAKAKEKEAEAELLRLRDMYRGRGGRQSFSQHLDISNTSDAPAPLSQQMMAPSTSQQQQQQHQYTPQQPFTSQTNTDIFGLGQNGQPFQPQVNTTVQPLGMSADPPTSMTTFDLEAMMQNNNLDNLFSWLPDFGDSSAGAQTQAQSLQPPQHGIDPNNLLVSSTPAPAPAPGDSQYQPFYNQLISTPMSVKPTITSPPTRRSRTPDDDEPEPASKKAKRPEKKTLVEHPSACTSCGRALARTIIRAPKSQIPDHVSVEFTCTQCRPVAQPPALNDVPASGSGIGTVDTRKRLRIAMEAEDEDKNDAAGRRAFCDVCQRVFGSGSVFGGDERENLGYMTEIICSSCDIKYSRCTDCGGGGGGRMGIGKWRMKQVFQPGRKTCSLSHTRLGDRPREIGVHVTPTDFTPEQLKEVLSRCKQLWNEKTLARLAVPEMLEIDLPPQLMNPIRNYQDVEEIVTRNWPNRESMIRAEGAEPTRFKRLLGLVWAHSKSRRGTRTVDIEEEWHKTAGEGEDEDDMSTVLDNVKRTNLVIPGGSELIGMWGGEWDMKHGALLVSTFIPFEGTDGEDSTALSVGEMITKVQAMRQEINQARKEDAARRGVQPDLVPQCEHLWVVSGGAMPLVRERIADILIRKRSFVHVDEYLTRHPDFINALNARPVGLHPDILRESPHTRDSRPPPLILVRWLGKDFDAQKILEIKQAEFGGKAKLKKKPKVK